MNERFNVAQTNLTMRRSRFVERVPVYQHAYHGDLCIDLVLEGLPGDNLKVQLHDYSRMSVPIAPIMGNIRKYFACFYSPKRILFNKTKQFYGEAEDFGIAEEVIEPYIVESSAHGLPYLCDNDFLVNESTEGVTMLEHDFGINPFRTFGVYLGVIAHGGAEKSYDSYSDPTPVNVLPMRAVLSCYNNHFRDQNFCSPYMWDLDATGECDEVAVLDDTSIFFYSPLPKVRKDNDMFVSFLPWAQKGAPVELPILGKAPLESLDPKKDFLLTNVSDTTYTLGTSVDMSDVKGGNTTLTAGSSQIMSSSDNKLAFGVNTSNLVADLTNATAVTISQLLYAVAYQDFLQRLCKFGSKYGDYIKAIFGVTTDDATQDIPEFLGFRSMLLNIDTVVQTTDHDSSENTGLGDLGGYSATRIDDSGNNYYVNYAVKEPGYFCFFSYYKHERVYSAGIDDIYLKTELLDYYQTPFANISDTPYPTSLIRFVGEKDDDNVSFGFNEPFLGYRNHRPMAKGFLNSNIPGSFDYWVLDDKYEDTPVLGAEFVEEDRHAIARALSTGEAGPDYISNTDYVLDWVRVMPLYSSGRIGNF